MRFPNGVSVALLLRAVIAPLLQCIPAPKHIITIPPHSICFNCLSYYYYYYFKKSALQQHTVISACRITRMGFLNLIVQLCIWKKEHTRTTGILFEVANLFHPTMLLNLLLELLHQGRGSYLAMASPVVKIILLAVVY